MNEDINNPMSLCELCAYAQGKGEPCPREGMDYDPESSSPPSQVEEAGQSELLPCPFCGKESSGGEFGPGPYIARGVVSRFVTIICSGCCSNASGETESRVIERWNTRADSSAEVVRALHSALGRVLSMLKSSLAGRAIACADEGIAEAETALALAEKVTGVNPDQGEG